MEARRLSWLRLVSLRPSAGFVSPCLRVTVCPVRSVPSVPAPPILGENSSFEADGGLLSASRPVLGSEGAEDTEQALTRRHGGAEVVMAEAGVALAINGLRVSVLRFVPCAPFPPSRRR